MHINTQEIEQRERVKKEERRRKELLKNRLHVYGVPDPVFYIVVLVFFFFSVEEASQNGYVA